MSVDEEMVAKIKAEQPEPEDPMEALRKQMEEEKKTMLGSNVGCDPA